VEASVDRAVLTFRSIRPRIAAHQVLTDHELASLRVPTLFLVGEHEVVYSAAPAARRLNRAAPQIPAAVIPNAGRDLTIAQAETVNREIPDFLPE
jgi:pimeloyl-ACP methyl ester carboxylesterase